MMSVQSQRGVGLMEVMVAALILAIAVLGYIALQYRSLDAANEAYYRTQAMSLARDLAERIRANQFAQQTYVTELTYQEDSGTPAETDAEDTPEQAASESASEASETTEGADTSLVCDKENICTKQQFAKFDVSEIQSKAQQIGMTIAMQKCSGVNRQCIYIAWDNTLPKDGSSTTQTYCTSGGTYTDGSRCIVMEAYE